LVSSKDSDKWQTFARRLGEEGLASLRFNFRGCGWGDEWSEGSFEDTTLSGRIRDYRAALDFLVSTGRVNTGAIGAVGSSFGGCTIIAAVDSRARAYVAMATPYKMSPSPEMLNSFEERGYYQNPRAPQSKMSRIKKSLYDDLEHYDLSESIKKIKAPILIVHGEKDSIPVSAAHLLYQNANEPKKLEIVPGGSHTFVDSGHLDTVIRLSIDWFKHNL
jgi:dienelactone hydrolase